jgi:hypothetical protein
LRLRLLTPFARQQGGGCYYRSLPSVLTTFLLSFSLP